MIEHTDGRVAFVAEPIADMNRVRHRISLVPIDDLKHIQSVNGQLRAMSVTRGEIARVRPMYRGIVNLLDRAIGCRE